MFCTKCQNDLSNCICPDIEERLASLGDHFIFRKCKKCKKHYARCKCESPEWEIVEGMNPIDEKEKKK